MKKYLILFALSGLISCEKEAKEDSIPLNVSKIIGSWQLVEAYISPGGAATWQPVEDGDIYNFGIDGTFSQVNTYEDAHNRSGNFTYENKMLKLTFITDGEEKWQSFSVEMVENSMNISPTGPTICIEGCIYRYQKIK